MFAIVRNGALVGMDPSEEGARAQAQPGDEIKPATFGDEPGRLKLQVHYKLEKFVGDVQSPETLIETIEGEG